MDRDQGSRRTCGRCGGSGVEVLLWPHSGETETTCSSCEGSGAVENQAPPERRRDPAAEPYRRREVEWRRPAGADPDLLYVASVDGREWALRLAGEVVPFATLVVGGEEVASLELDDWPPAWRRPPEEPSRG